MISQHAKDATSYQAEALTDELTADELRRLVALQRRCGDSPLCIELGMDLRRLEFARWLIQRGILNEGLERA